MKLGIFGGSFDPIHVGHLIVASEALYAASLDRVLVVPTGHPPHKPDRRLVPIEDRVAMVRLAIAGAPGIAASGVEARHETVYTVDTLAWARDTFGDPELFLIIGEDSLAELGTWRRTDELLRLSKLLVYRRRGVDAKRVSFPHRMLEGETIDVSSSAIRRRIACGAPVRFWVPEAVRRYIERHGLYRAASPC